MKTLTIIWRRLVDETGATCERCGQTGEHLTSAWGKLSTALAPLGIEVSLERRALTIEEFLRDPLRSNEITIHDRTLEEWLGAKTGQSHCCGSCGDAECRTILYDGRTYEAVQESLIIRAGLLAAAAILPVEGAGMPVRFLRFKSVSS